MERVVKIAVIAERTEEAQRKIDRTLESARQYEKVTRSLLSATQAFERSAAHLWDSTSNRIKSATKDVEAFSARFRDLPRNARDLEFYHAFDGMSFQDRSGSLGSPPASIRRADSTDRALQAGNAIARFDTAARSIDTLTNNVSRLSTSITTFDGSLLSTQKVVGDVSGAAGTLITQFLLFKEIQRSAGAGLAALRAGATSLLTFAFNPLTIAITAVIASLYLYKKWTDEKAASEREESRLLKHSRDLAGWNTEITRQKNSVENLLRIADAIEGAINRANKSSDAAFRQARLEFLQEVIALLDQRLEKFGLRVDEQGKVARRTSNLDVLKDEEEARRRLAKEGQREAERLAKEEARLARQERLDAMKAQNLGEYRFDNKSMGLLERIAHATERAAGIVAPGRVPQNVADYYAAMLGRGEPMTESDARLIGRAIAEELRGNRNNTFSIARRIDGAFGDGF